MYGRKFGRDLKNCLWADGKDLADKRYLINNCWWLLAAIKQNLYFRWISQRKNRNNFKLKFCFSFFSI